MLDFLWRVLTNSLHASSSGFRVLISSKWKREDAARFSGKGFGLSGALVEHPEDHCVSIIAVPGITCPKDDLVEALHDPLRVMREGPFHSQAPAQHSD
eukprot:6095969-Amphidinium_carterae.2